jgi:hypothetical protein
MINGQALPVFRQFLAGNEFPDYAWLSNYEIFIAIFTIIHCHNHLIFNENIHFNSRSAARMPRI